MSKIIVGSPVLEWSVLECKGEKVGKREGIQKGRRRGGIEELRVL